MSTWTSFVKIWTVSNCEFNVNFLTFLGLYTLAFCTRNYWRWLNHNWMANIWERAISILAGNLNLGRSYLITTVPMVSSGYPTLAQKRGKNTKYAFFTPFLSLCQKAWQPYYRLTYINALHINLSYSPKDQSLKFLQKNIENWRSWKCNLSIV